FLHKDFVKSNIPLGQIKYHKKNFQRYFVLKEKDFKNKEILDTGAGAGIHSTILSLMKANVTAVDLSNENIERIKIIKKKYKLKNLKFFQQDLSDEIKSDKQYDLISCHNWIQHSPNPYLILKNLSKKLKIGGKFYISCYQSNVFRCLIAKIVRSVIKPSDFNLMMKLALNLFPSGFKKYKNRDHAQFGLMFDDFFTPYFHTVKYEDLISDFKSLGFKPITKTPKFKNIYLEHMPYVRVGFLKISEKIKKNYSPFYIDNKVKFNKNNNKIIKETYRLINKLKNLKKTNKIEKILFCISLFDLSCEHSKNKSFEKYKILNSFLDRFITKNYDYLSDKITAKKKKQLFKI
ncbi:methyltransferase domain-containing protein, partial [Candidatus Pelagibacter bacterium]|nr:methyltransferase domain-containing protein [Candidatus Pelagibacter bacterium]